MALSDFGSILVKRYQSELLSILSQFDAPMDLVLEKELSSFIDQISPIQFLKSHGVEKIFYLEPEMNVGSDKRVYLIRPIGSNINKICRHVNYDLDQNINRNYLIIFVPFKTILCEELIESYALLDFVELHEWHIELIPLDSDLLSLESSHSLKNYLINECSSMPRLVASTLYTLFQVNISNQFHLHLLGEQADKVFQVFNYLKSMPLANKPIVNRCYFTDVILVDRNIDLITPLLTQISYEGLLDDIFGVQHGSVNLTEKVTGKSKPTKLMLNSNDPTYSQVRGYHISFLFSFIKDQSKKLIYKYDKGRKQTSISEMKSFVSELKTLKPMEQSLVVHLCACEFLKDVRSTPINQKLLSLEHALLSREQLDEKALVKFFESLLSFQVSWKDILRLLCLYSLLNPAPTKERIKILNHIEKQFIRAHGCGHINTILNLQELGLLNPQDEYVHMCQMGIKKLGLIPKVHKTDSVDLSNPIDTSFVFGGAYKPLSCTIIENFLKQGNWKLGSELLASIKFRITTNLISKSKCLAPEKSGKMAHKQYLVFFLGGCSYSEVNAIRFLGNQLGIEIGIATTSILNRDSIFQSLDDYIV
ncbi:Vacuolar protein sorting-associated protein 33B-like isoform X1 [Oopsacas minuta]|uniref:Vacuolar protein sorting-associated protein 33B-like isoform X1 n=1 Tax=Oopsacas minuta TaxID=111878 RepID=A0AAV7JQS2_9METZ|nr:Vacuolar protein sorting-associated protein 33B-like isoform X1 [Oopsacas minuta]